MFQQLLPQVEGEIVGGKIVPGEQNDSQRQTRQKRNHKPTESYIGCVLLYIPSLCFRASLASSVMSLHRWCKYTVTGFSLHVWTTSRTPLREHLSADKASSAPGTCCQHWHISRVSPAGGKKQQRITSPFLFPRTQNRHDSLEKCIKISRQGREGETRDGEVSGGQEGGVS